MRRCNRCIEPETAPNIKFDAIGICNYCYTHKKYSYHGEEELRKILDSVRRPDSRYDCIVMISGGRDSCYVLLKMVRDYHMKVLAVNHENPFTHPQALKNMINATKLLNVDLVTINDKNQHFIKTFRNNVKAWFKKPSASMIPMVCIACKTMWLSAIRIAREHDIHCIIAGGNKYEEIAYKRELLNVSRDEDFSNKFNKATYGILRGIINNPRYLHPVCILPMIKGYLFANEHSLGSKMLGYKMDRIELFDYIPWNEENVISRITGELDWDYPREYGGTWRFDCKIEHIRDYMVAKTLKASGREDFYSKMIREGVMSREEALVRIKNEDKLHMNDIEDVLQMAGITDQSFIAR
jgi:tRNA(Ile)-lysidine synthase TilS/MesJ